MRRHLLFTGQTTSHKRSYVDHISSRLFSTWWAISYLVLVKFAFELVVTLKKMRHCFLVLLMGMTLSSLHRTEFLYNLIKQENDRKIRRKHYFACSFSAFVIFCCWLSHQTATPALVYTPELIYLLANVSTLLNHKVKWYLGKFKSSPYPSTSNILQGIPFNDTNNLRLGIAELGQRILGDDLIGLQAGNEPDLYVGYVIWLVHIHTQAQLLTGIPGDLPDGGWMTTSANSASWSMPYKMMPIYPRKIC